MKTSTPGQPCWRMILPSRQTAVSMRTARGQCDLASDRVVGTMVLTGGRGFVCVKVIVVMTVAVTIREWCSCSGCEQRRACQD